MNDLESIQLGENALQFDNDYDQSLLIMDSPFSQLRSLHRYTLFGQHHCCWRAPHGLYESTSHHSREWSPASFVEE